MTRCSLPWSSGCIRAARWSTTPWPATSWGDLYEVANAEGWRDLLRQAEPALRPVFSASPYLSSLCRRDPQRLRETLISPPEARLKAILLAVEAVEQQAQTVLLHDINIAKKILRHLKAECHLLTALCDLGDVWSLDQVTAALTRFADAVTQAALSLVVREERDRGRLKYVEDDDREPSPGPSAPAGRGLLPGQSAPAGRGLLPGQSAPAGRGLLPGQSAPVGRGLLPGQPAPVGRGLLPGMFVLAMGKHGAVELNYSSDIDITFFCDLEKLPLNDTTDPQTFADRVARQVAVILSERTSDGYVFRVDLRLRPDPSSTPTVVSVPFALNYYESVGQNWERAAFIKARPVAGDMIEATAFMKDLSPFIWRRSLDYPAIADVPCDQAPDPYLQGRRTAGSGGRQSQAGRRRHPRDRVFCANSTVDFGRPRPVSALTPYPGSA